MLLLKINADEIAKQLERSFAQAQKTAINKATAAAEKAAQKELRTAYDLPAYGSKEPDADEVRYGRPAATVLVEAMDKLKQLGGLRAGVRPKVMASDKPIAMVRMMRGNPPPIYSQLGIPVKERKKYQAKFGGHTAVMAHAFLQRAKNSTQLFREVKKGERWVFRRQSLPSAYEVLKRPEHLDVVKQAAMSAYVEAFRGAISRSGL